MRVWVLIRETNSPESEGVEGVFATSELADGAYKEAIRSAIKDGLEVYWNPDTKEEGSADWEVDFHVEDHEVIGSPLVKADISEAAEAIEHFVIAEDIVMRDIWTPLVQRLKTVADTI